MAQKVGRREIYSPVPPPSKKKDKRRKLRGNHALKLFASKNLKRDDVNRYDEADILP